MNTVSVGGILDDRKTQTRRVIKPQLISIEECVKLTGSTYSFFKGYNEKGWSIAGPCGVVLKKSGIVDNGMYTWKSPYGKIGDRLWVRETWAYLPELAQEKTLVYKATDLKGWLEYETETIKWKPSIFMFRKYSRILLEITHLRIEQIQDISEEDAIAEGISDDYIMKKHPPSAAFRKPTTREAFRVLWDEINAKPKPVMANGKIVSYISYPWEDIHEVREHRGLKWVVCGNPWTWAVTFKVLKKEV